MHHGLLDSDRIPVTHLTRCHIDRLAESEGRLACLDGWIFHEDSPIGRLEISLQGQPWASLDTLRDRPDVQTAFEPSIGLCPHIVRSGFSVTAPLPEGVNPSEGIIVGLSPFQPDGRPLGPWRTHYSTRDNPEKMPEPPVHPGANRRKQRFPPGRNRHC